MQTSGLQLCSLVLYTYVGCGIQCEIRALRILLQWPKAVRVTKALVYLTDFFIMPRACTGPLLADDLRNAGGILMPHVSNLAITVGALIALVCARA